MISGIGLRRLQVPLTTPYKLAMGAVHYFDTILVTVETAAASGIGEATILTGYTDETIDQSWALAQGLAPQLYGLDTVGAKRMALAHFDKAPFVVSAFVSAIEMAEGYPLLAVTEPMLVPILAVINAMDAAGIESEIERAIATGYGTLKIKVGFDADADLDRVRRIQAINKGRVKLRLDANQGYSAEQGCRFAASLAPASIELFEQPCAAEDWDAAIRVAAVSTVPMMLDESIYGGADIERAAKLKAARFIKLKLMKMGGLDRLVRGLEKIRALGMEPVLGNGVATEIGCWMEACVARRYIRNAGEMNGFLKPSSGLLRQPLVTEAGSIRLESGFTPELDEERVARFSVGAEHFSARAKASA
ncbi:MAG TPA: enolase C-terminal domain-like protein [Alphaproteobacteria bacterium]|nr:enolase C-terminal domain-like protein [Alphaproteobacteria bacterium]